MSWIVIKSIVEMTCHVNTLIPEKWFASKKLVKYSKGKIIDDDADGSARYVMFDLIS